MRDPVDSLTERERETLRLLAVGHDAKSIARHCGRSVHTVNERLRDARRKLGVSSSREAARLLLGREGNSPDFSGDKEFGVADDRADLSMPGNTDRGRATGQRLVWFGGGMLVMSLIIATFLLSISMQGGGAPAAPATPEAIVMRAARPASLDAARKWVVLLDRQRWDQSWRAAAGLFRSQVTPAQWSTTMASVRQPLGMASARTFESAAKAASLPGAPAGEYEMLQFRTDFARKGGVVETVVMMRERDGWKTAGYFIR